MGQVSFHTLNNLIKLKNFTQSIFSSSSSFAATIQVAHVDQKDAETFSLVSLNKSLYFHT